MIVPAPISARAHGNHPARIGHLVVDLAQGGCHLVGKCARDNHDVGLAGGSAEDYAHPILVVARGGEVHHFNGAAGEAKSHGPEGSLAGPIGNLVHCCPAGGDGVSGLIWR